MKISIAMAENAPAAYPAIYKRNLFESVRKAHGFGYDGIEWHLRRPDKYEIEQMKKLMDALHIAVNAVGTGMACLYDGLTLMHSDREIRMQAVVRLHEFIDMAAILGCAVIIGSMKGRIISEEDREVYERYCLESLKAVLEYAGEKNVPVVLEVLNRYETNFLNTAEQMNRFLEQAGSPLLKAHLDTFHMNIEEASLYESIIKCKKTLGHVHFADSNRYGPGSGHIDFKPVIEALRAIGYEGWIAVECLPYADSDTSAQKAAEYLHNLLF